MKRDFVADLLTSDALDREVVVAGWVRTRRDSKAGLSFVEINDGSCFDSLQIVAEATLPNYSEAVLRLHPGASIVVTGRLVPSQGSGQRVEIVAEDLRVLGFCDPTAYPIAKQRISFERLRELAHLRPRTNTFGAVARVRHVLAKATHDFFHERRFIYLHTPIITCSDCEGAGEMFQVTTLDAGQGAGTGTGGKAAPDYSADFFGRRASLTVSGQLEAETYACALGNVYTFGPAFRAENSNTRRHLAEFWMVEPEMAFADLTDDVQLAKDYLGYLIRTLLAACPQELSFFNARIDSALLERLERAVDAPVLMSYTEAVERLVTADCTFEFPVRWGVNLQAEHERWLTETAGGRVVIVTDYPKAIKPFYMKLNDDGCTVAAMDVLLPTVGEIIGGSQREDRLDVLAAGIESAGLAPEHYAWYLDLRRFGSVPHAGFGMGFERMVQFCTGLQNIRDAIPFPRTPRNAEF